MTPAYALANVFLPNLIKLKGQITVMIAAERRDLVFFDPLWAQAQLSHHPHVTAETRDVYRIATITLPPPRELGDAHMAGFVLKANDPAFLRYFTLEHDHVLATRADRTLVCEREGTKHIRRGEGPTLTGNPEADARLFIDAVMKLVSALKH